MKKEHSSAPKAAPLAQPPAAPVDLPAHCRARKLSGIDTFTECLTEAPGNCKHLFIYGHGRFCTHPQRIQIVART